MKAIFALIVLASSCTAGQVVYVVHGFLSNRLVMAGICREIEKSGFETVNYGYPSAAKGIPELAAALKDEIAHLGSGDTVHFVTHSMGGLVVRALVPLVEADSTCPVVDRVVMVAPPNHGSELADVFAEARVARWVVGPNLRHLQTDSASLANTLPRLEKQKVGVIAGVRYSDAGPVDIVESPHDGLVSDASTHLREGEERLVFEREGHLSVMHDDDVQQQVVSFLKNGTFGTQNTVHGDSDSTRH